MITPSGCTSYKVEVLAGLHQVAHTYKLALFTSAATLGKDTTSYKGQKGEVTGPGYTAGGLPLFGCSVTAKDDAAHLNFENPVKWPVANFTARGALVYNDSLPGKNAVVVLDFGSDHKATNGPFMVVLSTPIITIT